MPGYKQQFGSWGESVAEEYLKSRGFEILMKNYRAERGEIDLIARDGNCVVFVEVKTGNSHKYGLPEERITRSKQRQLYKVASHYIQDHPDDEVDYRFDAVIVDGTINRHTIRYYPNAFYF